MSSTIKFYGKFALFSIQEEQSSLSSTVAGFILYPCFIWIFSKLWLGLNHNTSTLGTVALFAYIGLTEILFMTTLRAPIIDRGSTDFALSFVRPRFWPIYTSISSFSRTFYRRVLYLLLYIGIMPLFTGSLTLSFYASFRFLALLPLLTFLDILYSFIFTCIQIQFYAVKNFRLLFGKLFLIFGGVLAPLSDLPSPWDKIFLNTPFSDLVFQPCYFSIKGEFYQMSLIHWLIRISIQAACLLIIGKIFYRYSRNHYHNFGG
ncbi:MAG: hypothetical protein S4CHLAM81_00300 [Chlamydiales bacterium]|nr:hypothetical protein [Chlamydiales bacterium]MCH9634832.1 hypothetical protein [Chlamydiales bacterium]